MKTFLVAIDYSEESIKALELALQLASHTDAQLLLCHVFESSVLVAGVDEPVYALPAYATKKEALGKLRKFTTLAKKNTPYAVPIRFTVKAGNVVQELLELVSVRDVSMVIIGTRGGYTSYLDKILGTIAETLVQHAPCPVLAVPKDAVLGQVREIVFATALEPAESDALQVIHQVQRLFAAKLTLLYVDVAGELGQVNVAIEKNYLLQAFAEEEVAFAQISSASVAEGIEQYSKDHDADLVAFTVADHGIWGDLLHSSVASKMVQRLSVPMLALPKYGKAVDLIKTEERLKPAN
ncbi:nucleotide-binding universal stress UspA family protein [Pontibacter ummariensis]|uniref:Nucleotide-binding universal stress protein, UspA family n=1 Tax=Pontibacter ummariensis TaxID=1610492 RepID=A0A239JYH5_9BACT|nr:universal stress protein [Pontibacter ummariensis]PRY07282.1 nucleotide-binding universal stress UspA family protein [Pontibacter ummariensis]SNT10522.1 Nucleotide-binding universal stress protein, UspA family [Pontibacter ummariensis]